MDMQALHQHRKDLFDDAIHFRPTKRPALLSNVWTWKYYDENVTLQEGFTNYESNERVQVNFHERYLFDAYCDGFGTRNPNAVTDALGVGYHVVDQEKNIVEVLDHSLMEGDEYLEFASDPQRFIWSKAFRRYAPELTEAQFVNGMAAFLEYGQWAAHIKQRMKEEFGVVLISDAPLNPFEQMFNVYRGIKGISVDMRKHPDEILQLFDLLYETSIVPALDAALTGQTKDCLTDMTMGMLGHTILSAKQFEKFYWPYMKKVIDAVVEKNKTMYLFTEGTLERDGDFFRDVPQGTIMSHLEQDDIYEMRKWLPNICFAGGITSESLATGTKEQCVDEAKRLIDELGTGFVVSSNKMLSYAEDCKRENLLAVNEYILGLE